MSGSKQAYDHVKTYMLRAGLPEHLLEGGSVGTICDVADFRFDMKMPCGELRTYHVDLQLPSLSRHGFWNNWKKQLLRCQAQSVQVKLFGAVHIAGRDWRLDQTSLIVSQCAKFTDKEIRLYEWYSGGFGGWSRGANWLNCQYMPIRTVGAADADPVMVMQWNGNFALTNREDRVICKRMDANELQNWDEVSSSGANTISLSSSCRSFSPAGGQRGWDSTDGQSLALSLAYSHAVGCQIILLENVAALANKSSFREFLDQILEFVGLRVVFETVLNITNLHAADRTRLVMVLQPMNTSMPLQPETDEWIHRIKQLKPPTLWDQRRWLDIPEQLYGDLTLHEEVLEKYASMKHLPFAMKQTVQVGNREEILQARRVRSGSQMPVGCLMAAYTRQHEIA